MPIPVRKLRQILLGKLNCTEESGKKHLHYKMVLGEKLIAVTHMSRTWKQDIADDMVAQMARQLYLSPAQLKKIVDCSWGLDEYKKVLEDKGLYP